MSAGNKKWHDARNGAILQCIEAATLGMPLEVFSFPNYDQYPA